MRLPGVMRKCRPESQPSLFPRHGRCRKVWRAPRNSIHSIVVYYFFHKIFLSLLPISNIFRPHFLGVEPSIRFKPITVLLRDPAYPPFCKPPTFGLFSYQAPSRLDIIHHRQLEQTFVPLEDLPGGELKSIPAS
jgi:hypothetical protein